jgi:uracil-DNA glycosylase family 4
MHGGDRVIGQAGRLLTRLLEGSGLGREEVYLSNLVRFRPSHNRSPTSAERAAFSPYAAEERSILQPVLIVTLGRFATKKFLPGEKMTQVHGTLKTVTWQGKPVSLFPVYHPAAALRSTQTRMTLEEDFKKIPSLLGELLRPQKNMSTS